MAGDLPVSRLHENKALFLDALNYTAAETGFLARLIEKDYFCSLALGHISQGAGGMIFKGGTCLAKVYSGFYRLSEDLDFGISIHLSAGRGERSRLSADAKRVVAEIPGIIPGLRIVSPLKGAAASSQYLAALAYTSFIDGHEEAIKIEVSLREPFLEPGRGFPARTMLLDPVTTKDAVAPFEVPCISWQEAMAEKFRAAMTRLEPAIRDFYDIDHAVRTRKLDSRKPAFKALVRKKLAVPGNGPVDLSDARLALLRGQVDSVLRPVLRPADFAAFDLDRAFTLVVDLFQALK